MSDFGTLIENCVAETKMPGEEPALRRHAVAALKNYRPSRFLFSEKSVQFTLVPQQDEYVPGGETIVTPGYKYLVFNENEIGFVTFGDALSISNLDFSLSVRFRTTYENLVDPIRFLIDRRSLPGPREFSMQLVDPIDSARVNVTRDGGSVKGLDYVVPGGFNDGVFHEFTLSVSTTDLQSMYILWDNAIVAGPLDVTGGPPTINPPGQFTFANSVEDSAQFQYVGDLERVIMWNKGVNPSDVRYMMDWEEGDEIPDSVIGFWPLFAGQGSFIEDYVPAPNTLGPGFAQEFPTSDQPPHHGQASPTVDWGDDTETFLVDFPGDIMELDEVRRQIGTRSSVPLEPVTIGELRNLQASGLAYGQPDYYCWHHDRFIVWPRPSAAHVLTLDYHVDATRDEVTGEEITPASNGSATNEYFRRAEELLRARTIYTFALGRDDDYELAKRMKILNQEAERSLYKQRDIMKVDGFQSGFHF